MVQFQQNGIKKLALVLLFCIFNNVLFCQTRDYLMNLHLADSLFKIKEYSKAKDYYKCSLSEDIRRLDLYYLAICYYRIAKIDSGIYAIDLASKKGLYYYSLSDAKKDTLLLKFQEYKNGKKAVKRIFRNTENHTKKKVKDVKLQQELLKRKESDQKYRNQMSKVRDSKIADSLWKIQKQIDIENQIWLSKLVDKRGWPNISMVGEEGDQAAWFIIQHADNDTLLQIKTLRLLKKLVSNNETSKNNVAYLEDRVRINTGKKQLYGTQFETVLNKEGRVIDIFFKPMEDPDIVDARRKYMGLPTLEIYKKSALERY